MTRFKLTPFLLILLGWFSCQSTAEEKPAINESTTATVSTSFALQAGDLLFQADQSTPYYLGITKTGYGIGGAAISRVGMVQAKDNDFIVWEVTEKGVSETPLSDFLQRSVNAQGQAEVLVGRLRPEYQKWIPNALKAAYDFRTVPFDPVFTLEESQLYGAEFIYFVFKQANNGQPVFPLQPLSFRDRKTGEPLAEWVDYFTALGKFMPEKSPGISPGSISRSLYLEIIHDYGGKME